MFVDKKIERLLKISNDENCGKSRYVLRDFTLNWCLIKGLLAVHDSSFILNCEEKCLEYKEKLDPLIVETLIIENQKDFKESLFKYSGWTHSTSVLLDVFNDFCYHPELTLSGILRIFSVAEYSLGNVYSSITKTSPPHLLKDLLAELSNLSSVFESHQIFILQILAGTAKGLNLRNLCWHGFVEKVDKCYLSFLLILIVSYGKILRVDIQSKLRSKIRLSLPFSAISKEDFKELLSSRTIQKSYKDTWSIIIDLYNNSKFSCGLFLLLSQIENILRLIYSEINDIDGTARIDEYYIIMDSIFYEYVLDTDMTPLVIGKINKSQEIKIRHENKRNQIFEKFPTSLTQLGFDLFHASDGPRIRDKISHGEAIICESELSDVMTKLLKFISSWVEFYESGISTIQYQSIYMNNFKFARLQNEACDHFQKIWKSLNIPKDFGDVACYQYKNAEMDLSEIKVNFRPYNEIQVVKLLIKIIESFIQSLDNFSISSAEQFQLFIKRQLSSSRRKSLSHLVSELPQLYNSFHRIVILTQQIFKAIQHIDDDSAEEKWFGDIIKESKNILKLVEHLAKYFSNDHRNFFEAIKTSNDIDKAVNHTIAFIS